jgi:hypothetical protein
MKKPRRITKFTVETERTYVFRSRGRREIGWCVGCDAEVEMANMGEAAALAGVSELTVYRCLEAGGLHFTEDADGRLLVCLDSLLG